MYEGVWSLPELGYDSLISTSHPRLDNIVVEHKFIPAVGEEGETDSRKSALKRPLILLVPPGCLGTHEKTIGNPFKPDEIPPGYKKSGFAGIDMDSGWHGPPVAVAAYSKQIYIEIAKVLLRKGKIGLIEELELGDLGVLDGHHRRELAITKRFKFIPVQLIPFPYNPHIFLGTHRDDGIIWNANQVRTCFTEPYLLADEKRTMFQMVGIDGKARKIRHLQPHVHIPLANLV